MHRSVWLIPVLAALMACSPKASNVPPASIAAMAGGGGEQIYNGNCVPCHQQSGQGIPGVYPSLTRSPVVLGDPRQFALWVVKGQRPTSMPGGRYSTLMLQFGWMKAADATALLNYLRSSFGNSAPPADAAVVAEALGQ
ncbi:MAG: cytochrome c [Pseudomonadota bacterium]|nr:cytochrome c [Pseudomonadota bacterium]